MYYYPLTTACVLISMLFGLLWTLTGLLLLRVWGGSWWPDFGDDDMEGEEEEGEAGLGEGALIGEAVQPVAADHGEHDDERPQPEQVGTRRAGILNDDDRAQGDDEEEGSLTTESSIEDSDSDVGRVQSIRRRIIPASSGAAT